MTHSRLWTCDPHHRVMEEVTLANRDMGNQVQCVGGGVTLRLWKYDPRYRFWEFGPSLKLWTFLLCFLMNDNLGNFEFCEIFYRLLS